MTREKGEIYMTKVKYSKLNLKVESITKTAKIYDTDSQPVEIEVLAYLPMVEKIKLVTDVVNKSIINGIVRKDLQTALLGLQIVIKYTNLEFTEKTLQKDSDLYDQLESNGVISLVIDAMEEEELRDLQTYIDSYSRQMEESLRASISGLSAQTEAVNMAVKSFIEQAEEKGASGEE